MAGNAHRRRAKLRSTPCMAHCPYCQYRPKAARAEGLPWENKNGHRHNPTAKKRGKRQKKS